MIWDILYDCFFWCGMKKCIIGVAEHNWWRFAGYQSHHSKT